MERKEPTFSKPDMDEIRFREPARQRKSDSGNGLVWKIAIGVFVGMSICLIATCSLVGIGAAVVAEQEDQARKAAIDEFLRTAMIRTRSVSKRAQQKNAVLKWSGEHFVQDSAACKESDWSAPKAAGKTSRTNHVDSKRACRRRVATDGSGRIPRELIRPLS